jgi:hypothetical protein
LETPLLFKIIYFIQASRLWEWMLFILGYVYMYLIILDSESYVAKIVVETLILTIFWADNIFLLYCKSFDKTKHSSFFIFKNILILLMTIDLIVFILLPCYHSRPIRPFRILRACKYYFSQLFLFCLTPNSGSASSLWDQPIRMF